MKDKLKKLSKQLSYVLRHNPYSIGIELDRSGWVDVDELIDAMNSNGHTITDEILSDIVSNNDKQRFTFSDGGLCIRANQGHSIPVYLELPISTPPDILYHGTARKYVDSIFANGIRKQQRHHVHLSDNIETAKSVGSRHGKPVVLEIAANEMHYVGHKFYISENGVWLTDIVYSKFITGTIE